MRITFLIRNVWGMGGTTKTTFNTADALVGRGHEVTIVSAVRHKTVPDFRPDPRVRLVNLVDIRPVEDGGEPMSAVDAELADQPSFLNQEEVKASTMRGSSALVDARVRRYLESVDTDVLIGTHIDVNLYIEKFAPRRIARVAQEHMYLGGYAPELRTRILHAYPNLDAVVTVSEADADIYHKAMRGHRNLVVCIPNSVPACTAEPPAEREKVVMAAGRLVKMKGFDILIRGFEELRDRFPDWRMRIYGRGMHLQRLQDLAVAAACTDRIEFMGPVSPLDPEWARASIAVTASRFESFGLTLVEAMSAGLPVVCAAVPHGPIEIIEDGVNGLLVPKRTPEAFAEAMSRLMDDDGLREKLGAGARRSAEQYEPEQIVLRHEALFEHLLSRPRVGRGWLSRLLPRRARP